MRRQALIVATALVVSGSFADLPAQICRLSVAGLNQSRRVIGPISAECPAPFHSAPFGNWGATSSFGPKRDGHQFDGWCHDMRVCDNLGICRTDCKDGWYEWNSCTDNSLFQPPNCTLYNAQDCTEQVSSTGTNVLGTQTVDIPVGCPADSDGDGSHDKGGCLEVASYSHGSNFMSLYELDPGTADELVQTLYFPETPVTMSCGVWNCPAAASDWVAPIAYDSPVSPPKVYAEMATIVNSGTFLDPNGVCGTATPTLTTVSAASYRGPLVASASIASAFGRGMAPSTEAAATNPPPLSLSGVTVRVTDSAGVQRLAPLFFVSPDQINYLVPDGTSAGPATVAVSNGDQVVATGSVQIVPVAPGLFSANASGTGVAAAVAVKFSAGGSETFDLVFQCGSTPFSCVPLPVDLGDESDQVFLLLFGTGIRNRSMLGAVTANVGGTDVPVEYAGPQGTFLGLDQVNLRLPRTLLGRGEADIVLTVDGSAANTVTVNIR